jgi:hypothetical protein
VVGGIYSLPTTSSRWLNSAGDGRTGQSGAPPVILKFVYKEYGEASSFYVPYLHHKKSMHIKSD